MGGGALLDQVLSPQRTDPTQGNEVLGQIFGSKDVSRAVADNAASQTGLDSGVLRKMLPLLAMLVTGFMAKQSGGVGQAPQGSGSGGLGGLIGSLGGMFGGGSTGAASAGGMGALGGLGAMLDMNGDGNALDDILRMVGKGKD